MDERERKKQFNAHVRRARHLESCLLFADAADAYAAAAALFPAHVKVAKKIDKCRALAERAAHEQSAFERVDEHYRVNPANGALRACPFCVWPAQSAEFGRLKNCSKFAQIGGARRAGTVFLDQLSFDGPVFDRLYAHQRAGVAWLWRLHVAGHGGLLGDDMGMGKTVQIAVYLGAAYAAGIIDRALIVMPGLSAATATPKVQCPIARC